MNTFFKSSEPDLQKINSISSDRMLSLIMDEVRAQRIDLATIKRQLNRLINDSKLQSQVDDYYEEKPPVEVDEIGSSDSS